MPSRFESGRRPSASAALVSEADVRSRAESLADRVDVFRRLLERNGPPPVWRRDASFATLVRLVLEQQVSLASANAAFARLEGRVGVVTPGAVLASTGEQLRTDGFSRQKDRYVRGIAEAFHAGTFRPPRPGDDTDEARSRLLALSGIGPWTAACYALFVLGAPDVWPTGDRALHVSMAAVMDLPEPPGSEAAEAIAASWAPDRSTAARMLWHDYLGGRSYTPSPASGFR